MRIFLNLQTLFPLPRFNFFMNHISRLQNRKMS